MKTDDGVTSEGALVNIRLLSGSLMQRTCTFSDSGIVKCIVIVPEKY